MHIHVPTLMLALLMGFLLLTLQLAATQRQELRQPALRLWTQGCWAMLLGFALLVARIWAPYWVSVLFGNALIALGLLLYHHALSLHLRQRLASRWSWAALGLSCLWLALSLLLDWTPGARTALMSLLLAGFAGASLLLTLRRGWQAEPALRMVALTFGLATGALLLRAGDAWLRPEGYTALVQTGLVPGLTFLVGFLSLMGSGFGFVLACLERVARQMETMATLDGLTGCLNRMTTDTLLAHSLERGRREGRPLAFALLDLDHFKQINDQHGHRAGDAVLRAFVAEVRSRLRASDVLGRVGGEEFGIILPGTDGPGAHCLIEQVRRAVEALRIPGCGELGGELCLTVSAGVAVAEPQAGLSADALYARADAALYRAKHLGRNRVQLGPAEGGEQALSGAA